MTDRPTIFYFAYGANREKEMMQWITGGNNFIGEKAILRGWDLCVQNLSQVPLITVPVFHETLPLRDLLRKKWGDKFETYTIKQGLGVVSGILWQIDEEQRELVKNWERVGLWYKEILVKVETEKGKTVEAVTEVLGERQLYDRIVGGLDYKSFLLDRRIFKKIAKEARDGFFKRRNLKVE